MLPIESPKQLINADAYLVLAKGQSASIDYYVKPHLLMQNITLTVVNDPLQVQSFIQTAGFPRVCIIIRYLPKQWHSIVKKLHATGCQFIYFMDDDLMDPKAWVELPTTYVKKIKAEAFKQKKILENVCSEFWVSTPYLAQKYAHWHAKVIHPHISAGLLKTYTPPIWVCYHGTASHQLEFNWLLPLIFKLEQQAPTIRFEIFGDHKIYKQFRRLPRVTVIHPMTWTNYLDYTANIKRDIALAPLLTSAFNAGRGPTKFFDFTRMGAVGIYSDVEPYKSFVSHGVDGYLLPNDPELWMSTINLLSENRTLRKQMLDAAKLKLSAHTVTQNYPIVGTDDNL